MIENKKQEQFENSKQRKGSATESFIICVKHRGGWCATKRKCGLQYNDNVPTICGCTITFPLGVEKRIPDCLECLEILNR